MAQLDVFKNDCEKATNMLILWEKANYSDRKRCLKDLENLQTPLGLEQEWEFVKTLWKSFYETHRIDVSSTPCPDSLKNLDRQIILCRSDDVRKYISNIRDYVCAEEDGDDSASVNQEETVPKEEAPMPFHKEKILPVFEKYFNFFEGFAREEGDDKVYANFLADRFDKSEQTIISRFLSEEISNQTFVYGSLNAVETSESDVYDIWDCLITAKSIIIRHYHTDDEGHSDDYYAQLNWEDIYSVGQDSEYKTWVNFYDTDEEEIGSISIPMVCGHDDNKTIKKWMNILTEVVNAVHQDEKNDLLSNVVESLNSKGTSSERQGRKKGKKRNLLEKVPETDTRSVIQNRYVDLINCVLTTANTINSLHGHNSTFAKIQSAFFNRLEELLASAEKEMTHTLHHTVWDNLVVAFFGETNAGKSTIIETFRVLYDENRKKSLKVGQSDGVDGLIVGDGRADFTKVYEEYPMQIDGKPFTLIDVPGIEGKEDDFIDDIKKALAQAHLVFYVQGHNIKPDVATASKIKKYLGDWVNVYSVYNVRGGAFNYRNAEQRSRLIYGDTKQAEDLIKESFPPILGDVYKGNISLQALLALCAVANFSPARSDLTEIQTKVIKLFGSSDKLLKYSHFNDITSLISQKARNFDKEIVEANKQKLKSLGNFFVNAINKELNDQSGNIEKFSDELKTYGREVSNIYAGTKNSLKNRLFAKCDILFSQLQRDINEVIDINSNNSDIEDGINKLCNEFTSRFENNMTSIVEEELANMSEKLRKKQKSLDCYKSLIDDIYYEDINPNVDIDLSDALSKMSISLGEVLTTVGGAAIGAIIGSFFGGIGAIPGALIGSGLDLLRKSVFGDGGKSKAKNEIKKELGKAKDKTKSILNGVCGNVNSRIANATTKTSEKIKEDLKGLTVLSTTLDTAMRSLQDTMNKINTTSYGEI